MALTRADVLMWADLTRRGLVPERPRVLEIGQANWFNDVQPNNRDCDGVDIGNPEQALFIIARNFYKRMMPGATFVSIDKHGEGAIDRDLNLPTRHPGPFWDECVQGGPFNVIVNTGTAEHVFDQRQLFTTINDVCECTPSRGTGGLMIHAAPLTGWWEHGFYCYNPTFFRDLAAANGYEVLYLSQWFRDVGCGRYHGAGGAPN